MNELRDEAARLNRLVARTMQQGTLSGEVPLKLHSREVDSGGAPEYHPAFLRYLGDTSVCTCGRPAQCAPGCRFVKDRALGHLDACQPACSTDTTRFHSSSHRNHPNRLKRALRSVRKLNPKAYDLVYLIAGRGYSWSDATNRINASNVEQGRRETTEAEFAVLWISGASMMTTSY